MENEKEVDEESVIKPGVLALLALLSIGGLVFLGWQANVSGQAISAPYNACCSVQPWSSSAPGYRQGDTATSTELCDPLELPNRCCVRAGRDRFNGPVNLVSANMGICSPELSYPAGAYRACCTVQSYQRSPVGYSQGVAETFTQNCEIGETLASCCARGGSSYMNLPVRVLGVKSGSCVSPQKSYPIGEVSMRGYSACCSFETWRQSPTGYSQNEAQSVTGYCDELETQSQCCIRSATMSSGYPVKLLGTRLGSCHPSVPQISYPIWVR